MKITDIEFTITIKKEKGQKRVNVQIHSNRELDKKAIEPLSNYKNHIQSAFFDVVSIAEKRLNNEMKLYSLANSGVELHKID